MPTLINTHDAFRQLREEGGFSEQQANAIVGAFGDTDEEVATRSDLEHLSDRIDRVEKRLDERIEGVEKRLTRRIEQEGADVRSDLKGTMLATGGVICAFLTIVISLAIYLAG